MESEQAAAPYVISNPAHKEVKFIEKTISSMIAQKVRSFKSAIVNDGSTDRIGEVIERLLLHYDFIELPNLERGRLFRILFPWLPSKIGTQVRRLV